MNTDLAGELGETDWKVLVIDVRDPLAAKLNDIKDVKEHLPGLIEATREWFRVYKRPDGKPENKFAFEGNALEKAHALKIIDETNQAWKELVTKPESEHGIKVYVLSCLCCDAIRRQPNFLSCISLTFDFHTLHLNP